MSSHTLSVSEPLESLQSAEQILVALHDLELPLTRTTENNKSVGEATKDLMYAAHLLRDAASQVETEYWALRGRG